MVNTKPFVIEYKQPRVLIGCEFVNLEGNIFKSVKDLKEAEQAGNVQAKPIVFCPACGAGNRHDTWGFPITPESNRIKKHKGQCPNCGERLTLEYSYDLERSAAFSDNSPIPVHSVKGRTPTKLSAYLKWWPVGDDKLTIETVSDMYFSRTMYGQYWLHHEVLRYRYIFNFNTGLCYSMRGVDAKGNQSKYSIQTNRLQNRTFSTFDTIPYDMNKDFAKVVLDAIAEHEGLEYEEIMDENNWNKKLEKVFLCGNHRIGVSMLGWVNYFSDMKPMDLSDMLEISHHRLSASAKKNFKNLVSLSCRGEVEWLPKYMQKRSIRRRLNQRAVSFFLYRWLYACGVRDINVMNNIVDDYINVPTDKREQRVVKRKEDQVVLSIGDIVARNCADASNVSINFMKWALRGRSAKSIYQFVTNVLTTDSYLLSDSVRMYKTLPKKALPDNVGNIKELHGALVVVDRKWRFSNKEIEHTDIEKALEMDIGEYSFRLAKDTDSLYDIGKALSICVGSYGRDAVAKRCTIMTMSKHGQYVACIELRVRKKDVQMVQLKSRFNHTVKEIEPITEWVAATGVNAQCSDYQNAVDHKNSGFDECNRDYHVENPRFNTPVGHHNNTDFEPNLNFEDDDDLPFGAPAFPF